MTKYSPQDIIEEDGIKILKVSLDSNFFLINDFADIVGKDKYPDIDGQIRLRDGNGTYLNKYLHYQTKSHSKIKNYKKYFLDRKIIDYLIETNVPTLFFVVEIETKQCYWFFLTPLIKKQFNLSVDNKGRNIDLTKQKIRGNSLTLNREWEKIAKGDNYKEIVNKLDKILNKFNVNIQSCLGVIYLFRIIGKKKLPNIFSRILKIENHEATTIIQYLENDDIITSTVNYYILENDKLGIESVFFLLNAGLLDFDTFDKHLDIEEKKSIFEQLIKINHSKIKKYFNELSTEFKKYLSKFKNNDDIFVNLELLEKYIYRVPDNSIQILRNIIHSKVPLKIVTRNIKGWGKVKGKSHDDIILKSIELLERLRYLKPKQVLSLLLKLSISKNEKLAEKAIKSLEKQAEYNLFVLRAIGYQPQIFLLNELEKYGNNKILIYYEAITTVLKKIIEPSFEGNEMTDYKTFTIRSGGLNASNTLKKIRVRAIELLKQCYLLSKKVNQKKKIMQIFRDATQTPFRSYTKELEQLILGNTNKIILFYNEIIENSEYEIIKEMEEQSYWFLKRYKSKLRNIKKLQSLIAKNKEYNIFKIFVGFDYHFDETLDWREAAKERMNHIQEFVGQLSAHNYTEWKNKILTVISNYNQDKDYGKYQYFNIFLNELGKQKPEIARKLIQDKENELEEFLIHLIAGIWESNKNELAVRLIEKYLEDEKHLHLCAHIFSYVKEIDERLINIAFQKSKKNKNINALNNIIRSIVENYPNEKNYSGLFVETIKETSKLKNYFWINDVWYQKESIVETLSKKDLEIILNNLLLVPHIDYHAEAILEIIGCKYPLKLIKYFENRISIELKKKTEDRYDAIPFEFHKLKDLFIQHKKVIIPEVFKWLKKKDWRFLWDGGHFLKSLYLLKELDNELIKLLSNKKDTKVVLSILNSYQGHIPLDSKAVQTLIRKYPEYHERLISLMSITGGVVSGEYGFVNSLIDKSNSLKKWKNDDRKYIKKFVEKYDEYLTKEIEYEKKIADEGVELRKYEFN